jgi:D-glycero-alpha-D-manno-heptose-7-phosphate kinase
MRDLAVELFERMTREAEISAVGAALDENWRLKKTLHAGIATAAVDERYDAALAAGAVGGKILGAGGGGFLLFYVEPEHHAAVRAVMTGLRELDFCFDVTGSTIIHVGR